MAVKTTYTPQTNINAVGDLMQPQTTTPKPVPPFPAMVGPEISEPFVGPMPEAPPPPVAPPPEPAYVPKEYAIDYDTAADSDVLKELDAELQRQIDEWKKPFLATLAEYDALPWLTARQQAHYEEILQSMNEGVTQLTQGATLQREELTKVLAAQNFIETNAPMIDIHLRATPVRVEAWQDLAALIPSYREALDILYNYYDTQLKSAAVTVEGETFTVVTPEETAATEEERQSILAELDLISAERLRLVEIEDAMKEFEGIKELTSTWQGKIKYAWQTSPWYAKIFAPLAPHAEKLEWWARNVDQNWGSFLIQVAKISPVGIITGGLAGEGWLPKLRLPGTEAAREEYAGLPSAGRFVLEFLNPLYIVPAGKGISAAGNLLGKFGLTRVATKFGMAGRLVSAAEDLPMAVVGKTFSTVIKTPGKIAGHLSPTARIALFGQKFEGPIGGVMKATMEDAPAELLEIEGKLEAKRPDSWLWRHMGAVRQELDPLYRLAKRAPDAAIAVKQSFLEYLGYRVWGRRQARLALALMDEPAWKALKVVGPEDATKSGTVTALDIVKPKEVDQPMHFHDIFHNPDAYEWGTTDIAKRARALVDVYKGQQNLIEQIAKAHGIEIPVIEGEYAASRILGVWKEGKYYEVTRGAKQWVNPAYTKPRSFPADMTYAARASEGYAYADPFQTLALNVEETFNKIAANRVEEILRPFGMSASSRANLELKQAYKAAKLSLTVIEEIEKKVQLLKKGLPYTPTTRKGLTKMVKVEAGSDVFRAAAANPDLDPAVRTMVERMRTLQPTAYSEKDVVRIIEGYSDEAFKAMGITKEKFWKALREVRAKEVIDKTRVGPIEAPPPTWTPAEELRMANIRDYIKDLEQAIKQKKTAPKIPSDLIGKIGIEPSATLREKLVAARTQLAKLEALGEERVAAELKTRLATAASKRIKPSDINAAMESLGVDQTATGRMLEEIYTNASTKEMERSAASQFLVEARVLKENVKTQFKLAQKAYLLDRKIARGVHPGEGFISVPGFQDMRYPYPELAEAFNNTFRPEADRITTTASRISRSLVSLQASLDWSWFFIQGMPILMGNDVMEMGRLVTSGMRHKPNLVWTKALNSFVRSALDPSYLNAYLGRGESQRIARTYTTLSIERVAEYMAGIPIMEKAIGRVPIAGGVGSKLFGTAYGAAERAFTSAGTVARIELVKGMEEAWLKNGGTVADLGHFANMMTGVMDTELLALSPQRRAIESIALFAPRYLRANILVVKTALSGGYTAGQVRKMIGTMAGSMVASYVALCYATGQTPKLNPAPKSMGGDGAEFMSFQFGDNYFGLPGWWYSFMRLLGGVTAAALQNPDQLIALNKSNPGANFLYGRTGPFMQIVNEIATQRNFYGQKINSPTDWASELGGEFLPIFAQSLVVRDNVRAGWQPLLGEWAGLRVNTESPYQKRNILRERYAQQDYNMTWDNLAPSEKEKLLATYEDLKQWTEESKTSFLNRADALQERTYLYFDMLDAKYDRKAEMQRTYIEEYRTLTQMAEGLSEKEKEALESQGYEGITAPGKHFRDKIGELSDILTGERAGLDIAFSDVVAHLSTNQYSDDPKPPRLAAYYEYIQTIVMANDLIDEWGNPLYQERQDRVNKFKQKWGPDIYKFVQDELHRNTPTFVRDYYDAQDILRPYWEMSDSLALQHLPTSKAEKDAMVEQALVDRLYKFSPQALSAYNALTNLAITNPFEYAKFMTYNSGFMSYVSTLRSIEENKITLKDVAVEQARKRWRLTHPEAEYYLQVYYDLAPLDESTIKDLPTFESPEIKILPR